ncbi:helix-turn-helix domain-containing protein [Desulfomicrobium escambiense]|uniref:helix-turn-helix domain-containing protein n=1 Tax=Desulfomicrobium escambiense TaxID=29503 RepID=UPI0004169808|nr:helix-turn-helix transcriptional regulator [Desulfomicrobium escambiense]
MKTPVTNGHEGLLRLIETDQDYFLERWTIRMEAAGYLQHTTAKRVDCMVALKEFLHPILADLESGGIPSDFPELLRRDSGWERFLIESSRRHRARGITFDMFLGCFKTFIHSLLDVIEAMDAEYARKVEARRLIRLYGDALEVLYLQDWIRTFPDFSDGRLDDMNRLLTLEKCRFENILNATSDLILVVDGTGQVVNINAAVKAVMDEAHVMHRPIWEVLSLEGDSVDELLRYYPVGITCELAPFGESAIYRMQVNPLKSVSMASDQYIFVLTNMTTQAMQRETLERIVDEKTEALRREKAQLEEMNITLRNVLKSVGREHEEHASNLAAKVNTLVLPALERIESENDPAIRKGYVTVAKDQLTRLLPRDSGGMPLLLKLTQMEMKVCQFIQSGHSNKDIADLLNLSVETIQTHRKSIRRKLGLHGRSVSLFAHLNTMGLDSALGS